MIDTLQGICITCNDGPTCVRRKAHGKAVWYCEEFDDYLPPPVKTIAGDSALMPDSNFVRSPKEEIESAKNTGLCVNCDARKECSFSKPGSEIWQCNEYI